MNFVDPTLQLIWSWWNLPRRPVYKAQLTCKHEFIETPPNYIRAQPDGRWCELPRALYRCIECGLNP